MNSHSHSRQHTLHHLRRVHTYEAEVEALEAVAGLVVVEAEEVQDGGIEP